jgi:hypothetical protein
MRETRKLLVQGPFHRSNNSGEVHGRWASVHSSVNNISDPDQEHVNTGVSATKASRPDLSGTASPKSKATPATLLDESETEFALDDTFTALKFPARGNKSINTSSKSVSLFLRYGHDQFSFGLMRQTGLNHGMYGLGSELKLLAVQQRLDGSRFHQFR